MKKLFISQPMQGKSKEEILAERKAAICQAKEAVGDEVEIIDSYFENAPACNRPLWFLGESLKLLATADIAYFAAGWEGARGCKIEHTCAGNTGGRTSPRNAGSGSRDTCKTKSVPLTTTIPGKFSGIASCRKVTMTMNWTVVGDSMVRNV